MNWTANAPGATTGTANTDTASFLNFVSTEVTVDPYRNIGSIVLDSDPGITVTLSSGELHLTALGTISRTAAGDASSGGIVNSDIVLEGDYTFSNTSTASFLQFGTTGAPTISSAATTGAFTLTLAGTSTSADNIVASSLSDGVGGGQLGLTKSGSGTWTITNSNTFTGDVIISGGGGNLRVTADDALGTGAMFINGAFNSGFLQLDGAAAAGGGITLNNVSIRTENVKAAGTGHIQNLSGNNLITSDIFVAGTQTGTQQDRRSLQIQSFAGKLTISGDMASTNNTGSNRYVYLNTEGGEIDLTGTISNGSKTLAIVKVGDGIARITGNNTYGGTPLGTLVQGGVLLINNTTGYCTGTARVDVEDSNLADATAGGTLGGEGTIGGPTTLGVNTFLSAGAEAGLTGDLDFDATLDISGLASGTGGLLYELDGTLNSDRIDVNIGALVIGEGLLDLDDFDFTLLGGFGTGTYTLFDTNEAISGTLGLNLSGTLDGYSVELALADGGNDIVLNVIPQPGTGVLLLAGLGVLVLRRRGVRA